MELENLNIQNENTLNILVDISEMNVFKQFESDICNNKCVKLNGNTYDLVSVAFIRVNENGTPAYNNSTHFISEKKQTNDIWVLIDSIFPRKTEQFNSFNELIDKYVKNINKMTQLTNLCLLVLKNNNFDGNVIIPTLEEFQFIET